MIVTVVVSLCRLLDPTTDVMVCHEEVVHVGESLQECVNAQPGIADWKMKGRYASDEWLVGRIRCIPGYYLKKDEL